MTISDALAILVVGGFASAGSSETDERIWLDAKINGKPARMVFDSGAGASALCRQTVQKLGLRIMPLQKNDFFSIAGGGTENYSLTEDCTLTVGGIAGPTSFMVLDLPAHAGGRGKGDKLERRLAKSLSQAGRKQVKARLEA